MNDFAGLSTEFKEKLFPSILTQYQNFLDEFLSFQGRDYIEFEKKYYQTVQNADSLIAEYLDQKSKQLKIDVNVLKQMTRQSVFNNSPLFKRNSKTRTR